ncbi:MAG: urea amidolyase associated protein UAAP1 [Pseudomonadota bacterium]
MKPLYEDTLGAGCHWSLVVARGCTLQLTDLHGGANVGMLMYNPFDHLERLNIPDTLKCQHTFRLTAGHCLHSDMGRVFCSIARDDFGWHDSVCGTCDRQLVEERWGRKTYQEARNGMHRNGRDGFLVELAKHGMGKRDLAANLNLFSRVSADADGNLVLAQKAAAGAVIELRFEMDTLVILHTAPHPLDMSESWPARPVKYALFESAMASADDPAVMARAENGRGLLNNRLYLAGCSHTGCGGH